MINLTPPIASFNTKGVVLQTVYNVRQFGAVGNLSHDDSGAINDAIIACNAGGGGYVLIPIGFTCKCNSDIIGMSSVFLIGQGYNSCISLQHLATIKYIKQHNFGIRDLHIDTTNFQQAEDQAMNFEGSEKFDIMRIYGYFNGFGIVLNSFYNDDHSARITIKDNYLFGYGNNDIIGGGSISTTGPTTPVVEDVTIENNKITQTCSEGHVYNGAIDVVGVKDFNICNNTVYGGIALGHEGIENKISKIHHNIVRQSLGTSTASAGIRVYNTLHDANPSSYGIDISENTVIDGRIEVEGFNPSIPWLDSRISKNTIFGTNDSNELIYVKNSSHISIDDNILNGAGSPNSTNGIKIYDTCTDITTSNNKIRNITNGIVAESGCSNLRFLFDKFSSVTTPITATPGTYNVLFADDNNFGIGTIPNANSILDLFSISKAFLPPRMTTVQRLAVASPAAGMIVFDTDINRLCFYTTRWEIEGFKLRDFGTSLNFAGADYITMASNVALDPTTGVTFAAWVKPGGINTNRTILGRNNAGLQLRIYTDNKLQLVREGVAVIGSSIDTVPVSVWSHLAVTYDALGNYIFYINSKPTGSGTNLLSFTSIGDQLIGKYGPGTDYFIGNMKEVQMYNTALTLNKMKALFFNGDVDASCVENLLFNENTGASVGDTLTNTGTITNATWSADVPF